MIKNLPHDTVSINIAFETLIHEQGDHMSNGNVRINTLKYILAVVIYGTIGPILRFIDLPPEVVVCSRGVIGTLSILLFMKITGRKLDKEAIRANLVPLLLSGMFLGLNWVFLFAAYVRISVAVASLLNYTAPIMVVIIAPFLYKEKISPFKALCIATAFIGVVLTSGIVSAGIGRIDLVGITLPVLSAFAFVGIVICNKKLKSIDSYNKAVIQLSASALTVLPYAILSNLGKNISPDLRSLILTAMLGIIHTGAAYCLYFSALGVLSVQSIALFGYLEPVVSVLGSVFVLHQNLDIYGWIGAVLIIAASAASEIKK